ncbi:MAG: DUF1697 domain-containing protein [Dehalococcoidia bacterium]
MRYVAFLRAINVGKHNRITMAQLREVVSGGAIGPASTYLQTGNVLFDADVDEEAAAVTIERRLADFGLKNAPAVVRSVVFLEELVSGDPYSKFPAEEFTRYVTLFRNPLAEESLAVAGDQDYVARATARALLTAAPVVRERGLDMTAFLPKAERMQGTTRYLHVVEEIIRMLRERDG